METLKDKIAGVNSKILENTGRIEELKTKFSDDVKNIKAENKKYAKLLKKLEDMESSIANLFNEEQ